MDNKEMEILEKLYSALLKAVKNRKAQIPIMNGINIDTNNNNDYIKYNFGSKSNYKLIKKLFDVADKIDKKYELFDEGIYFVI